MAAAAAATTTTTTATTAGAGAGGGLGFVPTLVVALTGLMELPYLMATLCPDMRAELRLCAQHDGIVAPDLSAWRGCGVRTAVIPWHNGGVEGETKYDYKYHCFERWYAQAGDDEKDWWLLSDSDIIFIEPQRWFNMSFDGGATIAASHDHMYDESRRPATPRDGINTGLIFTRHADDLHQLAKLYLEKPRGPATTDQEPFFTVLNLVKNVMPVAWKPHCPYHCRSSNVDHTGYCTHRCWVIHIHYQDQVHRLDAVDRISNRRSMVVEAHGKVSGPLWKEREEELLAQNGACFFRDWHPSRVRRLSAASGPSQPCFVPCATQI